MRYLLLALAPIAGSSVAAALATTDVYVDAAAGDDANGTGSAVSPWRTVTHALGAVSGPGVVVHVGPGLYDAALGEQYPLLLESGVSIVGAGVDATELRANPQVSVLYNYGFSVVHSTLLADLTLSHGYVGVDTIHASPTLLRLRFDQCDRGSWMDDAWLSITDCEARNCVNGFLFGDSSGEIRGCRAVSCTTGLVSGTGPYAVAAPLIERFTALACGTGISLGMSQNAPNHPMYVRDALLESCGVGANVFDAGWGGPFDVAAYVFERCRIASCTTAGVQTQKSSYLMSRATQLLSSVVAQCAVGVLAQGNTAGTHAVFVDDSTISGCSVGARKLGIGTVTIRLSNAIVWGNGTDLATDDGNLLGVFQAAWSNLHAPPITATGPLFDVDPLFANPGLGDFRLLASSPLIDAGNPAHVAGGTDRDVDPRVLDGLGTGPARIDIGADEYNRVQLAVTGVATPGAVLVFDVGGPAGWVHATAVSAAQADLSLGNLGSLLIAPFPLSILAQLPLPAQFSAAIPADPTLQGAVFYLQSLGLDVVSGLGSASNRVTLAVL